jgi:hypothetical protein
MTPLGVARSSTIFTEDCVFYEPRASTVAATRSIASQARLRLLTLTFDISQLPGPKKRNGGRIRWVSGRPGEAPAYAELISSFETAGFPPFIYFSTSYPEPLTSKTRDSGRIPSVRRGRRALDQGRNAPFIGTASELLRIRIESRYA